MKRTFVLIAAISMFFGCETKTIKDAYVVEGTAKEVYNGIRIYLNNVDQRGRLTPIDTAMVMNESFTFEGALKYPKVVYLTMNSVPGRYPVMLENGEMQMTIDKTNLQNTIVTGSESHDNYMAFAEKYRENQKELMAQGKEYNKALYGKDSLVIKTELEKLEKLTESAKEFPYEFMENHPNDFVSLEIYEMQTQLRERDDQRMIDIFNAFDESLKTSSKGIRLNAAMMKMKLDYEANKKLQIGMKAPEFSGPNPEGKTISLSEVIKKGKVTVVDFWAAWCGPCRKENPNVVRIYNEYHDKGLEIIGVSLDGQSRQKDPKQAWLDAIEEDKLTWHQVSNLKYFSDPIAKTYNIQAIPATYILDSEGNIVAKNLRGPALDMKIRELLEL
ncbi:AhpC/TSA family protein [Winogradskyella sp. DF17]|uniref:AhpC/TSA family protein n=1 Tax=Winogradskyella pelagia TaxID=2819984 RepID=A0ABS3T120_9FLAO|nr:TlpA disulfide reductase family protein [Winogradskyella sp. DF17]MBO3116427.1 AhpC/TSA family protein [Winogradskyella sp. DF17]